MAELCFKKYQNKIQQFLIAEQYKKGWKHNIGKKIEKEIRKNPYWDFRATIFKI